MKKDGESQGFEQARSADLLRPFSVCFANPRGMAPRTAAGLGCAVVAAVLLWQNERETRCGASWGITPQAALSPFPSLVFPAGKTAIPRGRNHSSNRQADHASRDRARETRRKRAGTTICKLACNIGVFDSFSYSLPPPANPRSVFEGARGTAFDAKAVPRTSPLPANEKAARKNRTAFIIPFMRINRGKYP